MRPFMPRLIAPLLLLAAGLAHAQYSWIDEKGVRQLSDRPPPPGTPANKILRAPGKLAAPFTDAPAAASAAQPATTAPDRAAVEKDAAQFRHFLQVAGAKQAVGAAPDEKARQRYCLQARKYKDWLASGAPMNKTEDGQSRPLSQEERASEMARAQAALDGCP